MSKFEAGNDPAKHTVAEVVEFLNGDDVTGDEYERVMAAERENRARPGIISLSGQETAEAEPVSGDEAAGPNERATGQQSPADEAKTVDDPNASGDAGLTAEPYPDEAPADLGPEMPQSAAEEAAHAATTATMEAAQATSVLNDSDAEQVAPRKTQTPEEALNLAVERSNAWKTR